MQSYTSYIRLVRRHKPTHKPTIGTLCYTGGLFATVLPQFLPVLPPLAPNINVWLCVWLLEPIVSITMPT